MYSPKREVTEIITVLFNEYGSIGVFPPCLPPIQSGREIEKWLEKKKITSYKNPVQTYLTHRVCELLQMSGTDKFTLVKLNSRVLIKGHFFWEIQIDNQGVFDKIDCEEFSKMDTKLGFINIFIESGNNGTNDSINDFIILNVEVELISINDLCERVEQKQYSEPLIRRNFNCEPNNH